MPKDCMKISVIIAFLNAQDTLEKCLCSIRDDLVDADVEWEIVICDDGSSDSSADVIKSLGLENLVLIKNDSNMGLPYSLNRCLSVAQGELVIRQDADDYTLKGRIKNQLQAYIENNEPDVVGCSAILVDDQNIEWGKLEFPVMPNQADWYRRRPIIHATALMKKSSLQKVGGYDVCAKRVEDLDLWFKMLAMGMKIVNSPFMGYAIKWSRGDYVRKKKIYRIYEFIYLVKGFMANNYPLYAYFYTLKPLCAALIPSGALLIWHKLTFKKD